MRDAFPIVAMLGDRFQRERTGWRDVKALLVLTAESGCWDGAAALADALGVSPDAQEAVYREVYGEAPPPRHPGSDPGQPHKETTHDRQPTRVPRYRNDRPRRPDPRRDRGRLGA